MSGTAPYQVLRGRRKQDCGWIVVPAAGDIPHHAMQFDSEDEARAVAERLSGQGREEVITSSTLYYTDLDKMVLQSPKWRL